MTCIGIFIFRVNKLVCVFFVLAIEKLMDNKFYRDFDGLYNLWYPIPNTPVRQKIDTHTFETRYPITWKIDTHTSAILAISKLKTRIFKLLFYIIYYYLYHLFTYNQHLVRDCESNLAAKFAK